jgi:hypothetical protein
MQKNKKWIVIAIAGTTVVLLGIGTIMALQKERPLQTPAFLPGVYTCRAQNEFCQIEDTLTIRRLRMEEDNYGVTRGTCFIRIRLGKKDAPEYQQQRWTGTYEFAKCRLVSDSEKDTLWYYPARNRMSKGSFYYEKIE